MLLILTKLSKIAFNKYQNFLNNNKNKKNL